MAWSFFHTDHLQWKSFFDKKHQMKASTHEEAFINNSSKNSKNDSDIEEKLDNDYQNNIQSENVFPDDSDLNFLQWNNVSPRLKWFYQPHRLLFLSVTIFCLMAYTPKTPLQKLIYTWSLLTLAIATFVQDGPLVRPHPFFWRLVLAFCILQIATHVYLTVFQVDSIVEIIRKIAPNTTGDITPDRDYACSCQIYDPTNTTNPFHNVTPVVFDIFVPAHFFGWIAQAIVLRSTSLSWIASVLFEWCERSLKHWFPNFNECWWDSVLLDVFGCNALGIWIGMKLVDYLALVPWEKRLYSDCKTGKEKISRMMKQFTPRSYTKFEWKPLESPRRYFVFWMIVVIHMILEVNVFSVKMVFKMTPKNPFVITYLIMHIVVAAPSVMEWYMYAIGERNTIGAFGSACILLAFTEISLVIKQGHDYFTAPIPIKVAIANITLLLSVGVIFPLVWFGLGLKKKFYK